MATDDNSNGLVKCISTDEKEFILSVNPIELFFVKLNLDIVLHVLSYVYIFTLIAPLFDMCLIFFASYNTFKYILSTV